MRESPSSDEQHMRRALDLARAGVGLVSPNPAVGAVVVDASGREVGSGTHTYDGIKHAEVLALEQAGDAARGGTLYLNLEPCSHQGRTGPCADAVIAAGIRRVVCSMADPNPRVAGRGFAKLRESSIKLEVGLFEAEAKKLNESFAKYIRSGKPLVTLKSAMTLDGKIADATKPGSEPGSAVPPTEGARSERDSRAANIGNWRGTPRIRRHRRETGRTRNYQPADRRWSARKRGGAGVGRGGQSIPLLRTEDFWRGRCPLPWGGKFAREGAMRAAVRVAPLRRRLRAGRLSAQHL